MTGERDPEAANGRRDARGVGPIHGAARRVLWFVLLWGAGVAAIGLVALLLRTIMRAV